MKTKRNTVKRLAARGHYDSETINRILDDHFICHVAFIYDKSPVVIPTIFGRKDNFLFFHGSSSSRMLNTIEGSPEVCINVNLVDGIVLARSGFHSSLNYRSVVVFGKAEKVVDPSEKTEALKAIMDHMIADRWEEVRKIKEKELNITDVYKISLDDASAKIREGGPKDELHDYELDIWAGVIPVATKYGRPIADESGKKVKTSNSVLDFLDE